MSRIWSAVIGVALMGALGACASQQVASGPAASSSVALTTSSGPVASSAAVITTGATSSPPSTSPVERVSPSTSVMVPPPLTSGTVSTTPSPTGSASTPSSTKSLPPGGSTTAASTPAGQQLTLSGTVQAGVQRGCLLLKDTATGLRVNLTGADAMVKLGAKITVTGVIRKDLMSYCQQGPIFQVLKASAE